MFGWNGVFLRVNLGKNKAIAEPYDAGIALNFIGGRGLAAKILWDQLKPRSDPLSSENILVFAAGPLTGLGLPSSGKLIVAAKSPLTGGYGDGNIGTQAAIFLRKAGFDAVIIEGKAKTPVILHIKNRVTEFLDARDFWGLSSFETERMLKGANEQNVGVLSIGPAGENLVKFATIMSQEGRAGGRPGIGAVMGSKNLKAVIFRGAGDLKVAHPRELKELAADSYREILTKPSYSFWKRQGTMATIEWSQENSVLPTCNFREGVFAEAHKLSGFAMEEIKVSNRGCPSCNMTCGNVVVDSEKRESELDYENVAMLGSNLGLGNLAKVATLNRMADELGLDTISLGNVLGFAIETSQKNLIPEKLDWGNFEEIKTAVIDISQRRGLGDVLADGVQSAASKIGHGSPDWAMHIKGLEVSAYNCHAAPAMALSYATSSIGAHHKDAWIIGWEVKSGRESYDKEKVERVIKMQRVRGGILEYLTLCRFPYAQLGFESEWYPKFMHAATDVELTWNTMNYISDRILTLIRAFWIREYGRKWKTEMDLPPVRWFREPLTKGPMKGTRLDQTKFGLMLQNYYRNRGWDQRGIPRKATFDKLGISNVARELEKYVDLS